MGVRKVMLVVTRILSKVYLISRIAHLFGVEPKISCPCEPPAGFLMGWLRGSQYFSIIRLTRSELLNFSPDPRGPPMS